MHWLPTSRRTWRRAIVPRFKRSKRPDCVTLKAGLFQAPPHLSHCIWYNLRINPWYERGEISLRLEIVWKQFGWRVKSNTIPNRTGEMWAVQIFVHPALEIRLSSSRGPFCEICPQVVPEVIRDHSDRLVSLIKPSPCFMRKRWILDIVCFTRPIGSHFTTVCNSSLSCTERFCIPSHCDGSCMISMSA